MKTGRFVMAALLSAMVLAVAAPAAAQPQTTSTSLGGNLYLVHTLAPGVPTPGGEKFQMNNLLLVQPDGVVLVDTLFPNPYASLFVNAIHTVTGGRPVGTLINTHWHFDHVGLNIPFRAQDGAAILAHWRTAEYLVSYPTSDELPFVWTLPFTNPLSQPTQGIEGEQRLVLQNEEIVLKTFENAHSGADLMVFLTHANVVDTGDIYFGGMYPVIDRAGGGTINGMLAALHYLLAQTDEDTVVVPSHGPAGNRQSVANFVTMLETTRRQVRRLIAQGFTEEQVMTDPSFAGLDAQWGTGFITGALFRRIVYRDMVSQQ